MSGELDEADKAAARLAHAYQLLGEVCIVVRTIPGSGNVRAICPQMGAPVLSEFLHKAADAVFNGPAVTKVRH